VNTSTALSTADPASNEQREDLGIGKKRTPVFLLRQAHQNKTKNQLYLKRGVL